MNKKRLLSKKVIFIAHVIIVMIFVFGCKKEKEKNFLGSAVVESTTITPSTTVGGELIQMNVEEGSFVKAGQMIALVDTIPIYLKFQEIEAAEFQLREERTSFYSEQASLKENIKGVKRELDRVSGLVIKGAVPAQKKDQFETQYKSLNHKLNSTTHKIKSLNGQTKNLASKKEQLLYQLKNCKIHSPFDGMVLTVYKRRGEIIGPGSPVVEIGRYDTMKVDFFIPQTILSEIKIGSSINVRCDTGGDNPILLKGYISWINSEAEFSPENIQTRESRNGLVFRIRALVPNADNVLKRGLPVEVWRAVD